jgi:hypothetical protein
MQEDAIGIGGSVLSGSASFQILSGDIAKPAACDFLWRGLRGRTGDVGEVVLCFGQIFNFKANVVEPFLHGGIGTCMTTTYDEIVLAVGKTYMVLGRFDLMELEDFFIKFR